MTVPSDPIRPASPSRPGTVTTAGYTLLGIAVVSVIGLITSLASYPTIRDVYADAYKGTPMEDTSGAVAILAIAVAAITVLLIGGGAAVLAPLVLKGKQAARIITWVLCGLVVCCQGAGLASSGVNMGSFGQSSTTNGVDLAEVQRQLTDSLPGWIRPVELASGALMVVLAIVVIVLLAMPASHPFFRKQPDQFAPPAYPTV